MELSHGGGASASLYEYARGASVYCAYAAGATALPAYTATALGPLLWNGATGGPPQLKAVLIGVGLAVTTASAAAVAVGLTWGSGQTTAPSSTTAITLVSSTYANGKQPSCTAYGAGTVSAAGYSFLPLVNLDTAALTATPVENLWIPIDGMIVLPQGSWCALAASATATTSVLQVSFVWAEVKE
jgi:hypothetical protein